MKILLLGRGVIAKKCIIKLYENGLGNKICGMIGDYEMKKIAQKNKLDSNKIKQVSLKKRNEKNIDELIKLLKPDLIFSIQYPWIISSSIIKKLEGKIFNLHNAKLPDYRGHNSISHEILNQEKYHFATIHKIDEKVDMGEVYFEAKIKIHPQYTAYDLWLNSHTICVKIFFEFVKSLKVGIEFLSCKKISKKGRYYKKHEIISLKEIKNPLDKKEIELKYKAFNFPPHEPAFFKIDKTKIYLTSSFDKNLFYN